MLEIMKKMIQNLFFNYKNGTIINIIRFMVILLILPHINENRIIETHLYSITAKFNQGNNQKILHCDGYYDDDCGELFTAPEKIKINNGNEENYYIDNKYNLTEEINIIEYFWENMSITSCAFMFNGCENITEIDFSNFNTSNVTTTAFMFYECTNLISLNLSNFDTSKVTNMFLMFYICTSLTSLDLTNFDLSQISGLYGINFMFGFCGSLTSLNLSSFNTSKITSMSGLFVGCISLISLDLSNFDTSKVVPNDHILDFGQSGMNYMFYGCISLISLNLLTSLYQKKLL